MPATQTPDLVEDVLNSVGECFTRTTAEALVRLRASEALQQRLEDFATRNTEGALSIAEREEYESLVWVEDFVAILQATARRQLKSEQAA